MEKALVFDGYVDEPSCFGVPPYISPYVRYAFGLLRTSGFDVSYITADRWRESGLESLWKEAAYIVLISGFTVPGRYRGGSPLLLRELEDLVHLPRQGMLFFGGSLVRGYSLQGGRPAREMENLSQWGECFSQDPVASLATYLRENRIDPEARKNYEDLAPWAVAGAPLVLQHPQYPRIIAELELSEGCSRQEGHCSFCTEWRGNPYRERPLEDLLEEVRALADCGVQAFRLGKCSDILSYGGMSTNRGRSPNPQRLHKLYHGLRQAAPNLRVLHTDNCNPLTVARFPEESRKAVEVIASHNTEGDCLSLGIENLDPRVSSLNHLKVTSEEALQAVRIINEAGGWRHHSRGLPKILPGLNFLLGLPGEIRESLEYNTEFLESLVRENLLVRRINIRKVIPFPGSPVWKLLEQFPPRTKPRDIRRWKEWVREKIDPLMFQRFAPLGTLLPGVFLESRSGHCIFGRALGSYPPLVGIMDDALPENTEVTVAVTDYGKRSLTGVPFPLSLETCSRTNLLALPGIGKARADRIFHNVQKGGNSFLEELLDDPALATRISVYFTEGKTPQDHSRGKIKKEKGDLSSHPSPQNSYPPELPETFTFYPPLPSEPCQA